jgi:hypothetical protein
LQYLKYRNPAATAQFSSRFVGRLGPRHSTVGANEQCGVPSQQRQIDSDDFERSFAAGHWSDILELLIAPPFDAKRLGWRAQFAAEPTRCFTGFHRVVK